MDEKIKKIMLIVIAAFILLFVFLFLISSCESKISPLELESEIVENAKRYFENHKEELPSTNSVTTLSVDTLVSKGIIKELDKILDDDTNCSLNLTIENNNNYYMYSPKINCSNPIENYKTENLKSILLENIVTEGNGLHLIGDSYYFRGDVVNNYLIFDGILWRITKINSDNSIRLIEANRRNSVVWDDRYNADKLSATGINNYTNNGLNSRIKDYLNNIYQSEDVISNDAKGFIKETNLCIGKRSLEDTINDGSIECSETLENQYIGLIQLNEYLLASLDLNCTKATSFECSNYNYLSNFTNSYWSITANKDNNYQVYKISSYVSASSANNNGMARMVINISENTNVTGTGTEKDPYVVSGFSTELKKFN